AQARAPTDRPQTNAATAVARPTEVRKSMRLSPKLVFGPHWRWQEPSPCPPSQGDGRHVAADDMAHLSSHALAHPVRQVGAMQLTLPSKDGRPNIHRVTQTGRERLGLDFW